MLLATAAVGLVAQHRRVRQLRAELLQALRRADVLDREIAGHQRRLAQDEQDRQFLLGFLREFPHLTRELHGSMKERQIPPLLLRVMARAFEPQQALVLLRRRPAESDPERQGRLVVAAALSEAAGGKAGTEVVVGQGELGFVAETQRVMNRHDFDSETAMTRMRLRQGQIPGFEPDLVAPLVFSGNTVGVIALAGAGRSGEEAKAALRLVAEAGAKAVHDAAAFSQMKFTADVDGLTGVLNKRQMTHVLAETVYDAERRHESLSIFLFDLDHFKNYNDKNGHLAGDGLLQNLARLVGDNVRSDDIFGRFGGEEFLLLLPATPLDQALTVADKIRAAIEAHPFPFAEMQPLGAVTVSGGVAEYPDDGLDSNALLRAADKALYEAKRRGRNLVCAADRGYLGGDDPDPGAPVH